MEKRKAEIVICGAFGIGSAGDEAGLSFLVNSTRDFANYTVLMRHPSKEYAEQYGVSVARKLEYHSREEAKDRNFRGFNGDEPSSEIYEVMHLIQKADLLIVGPGDFVNEDCPGILRGALPEMVTMAMIAEWVETPVMVFAASARLLHSRIAVVQTSWLLRISKAITFRNDLSVKLLKMSGVKHTDRIRVLSDPVLGPVDLNPLPKESGTLAISVRSLAYKGEAISSKYRRLIYDVAKYWTTTKGKVVFIPQFTSDTEPDDRQEASIYPFHTDLRFDQLKEPWEKEAAYTVAEVALVTRLHAAVFCYKQSIPFVAISYEPKVKAFVESVGGTVFDVNFDINAEEVVNALVNARPLEYTLSYNLREYRKIVLDLVLKSNKVNLGGVYVNHTYMFDPF